MRLPRNLGGDELATLLGRYGYQITRQMRTFIDDAALWQAARSIMHATQQARLEALHFKLQQQGALTADEQAEEEALVALYRETILIRAQAAVLLKQRGYDVSDPEQFAPLGPFSILPS